MTTTQIAVRLDKAHLELLDWIVVRCGYDSRADGVRAALEMLGKELKRREIDEAVIEGYTRIPETDEELEETMRLSIESIEEEPWEKWW